MKTSATTHKRAEARRRAIARVKIPLSPEQLGHDPLKHNTSPTNIRLAAFASVGIGTTAFYGIIFVAFAAVGSAPQKRLQPRQETRVEVREFIAPAPIKEKEAPSLAKAPAPKKKIKKRAKAKPKPIQKQKLKKQAPPPDPIDLPPAPEAAPKKTKNRRRIVGIDFSSTVTGGNGPSFGVGNTRMGGTEKTAADPSDIQALHKEPTKPEHTNRAATRLPVAGVRLIKPKLANANGDREQPPYPELLRKQGIEADVVVVVEISRHGKVTKVIIVDPSPYPEFTKAARAAAHSESYLPATRNGKAVAFTLGFTYRFRLDKT